MRKRDSSVRNSVDLMRLCRGITELEKYRRSARSGRLKGTIFVLIAVTVFFLLGYFTVALYIPAWAKALILAFIAISGFIPCYVISALFR